MKKLILLFLVITTLLCTVACSPSKDPEGYALVSREDEIFNLYAPKSWQDNSESGISGAYYSLGSAVMVSASTKTVAEDNITLDEYLDVILQSYEATLADFKLVAEPVATTLGSYAAYCFDYSMTSEKIEIRFRCTVAKTANHFTVLSCCAPADEFDKNIEVFEEIASHFTFRDIAEETETEEQFILVDEHTPDGFHLASRSELEYRLFVPDSWIVDTKSSIPSARVALTDVSNISMMSIVRQQSIIDGKSYWESFKANYDYDLVEIATDENAKLGKYTAFAVEYKTDIMGLKYHSKQVFLTSSDIIYVFTYTSDEEHYELHLDDVNTIISMFEFK